MSEYGLKENEIQQTELEFIILIFLKDQTANFYDLNFIAITETKKNHKVSEFIGL